MLLRAIPGLGCTLALCVATLSCTSAAEAPPPSIETLRVSRTTANEFEPALSRLPNVRFEVATSGGSSITSLLELREGKTDVAMPFADVVYLAYAGQLEGMEGSFDQLRGLAVTTLSSLHLLVGRNISAGSVGDLKGLRVSLGAPGSSTALITERMLEAHGIGANDVRSERVANRDVHEAMASGRIDAAFVAFIPPSNTVSAVMREGARLAEIGGPIIEEMRTRYPYLKRTLIPRGTYPNQTTPVRTVGVDALLVCRADLDEELVYRLLDAYFASRPASTPPNLERAPATPIPLHAGAARYYRQRELSR